MKNVIIEIIKDGWIKNLPVCEVIANIISATGLYQQMPTEVVDAYFYER